jgi:type VI secretion system Hcp family effector
MEVSTWDIKGESGDKEFGADTSYEMFQVFNIEFSHTAEDKSKALSLPKGGPNSKGVDTRALMAALAQQSHSSAVDDKTDKGQITVSKSIDLASPQLFVYCANKKPMDWAIIYLRESGEENTHPWLRLEFTQVYVKDFKWSLDPGASGEEAMKAETLTFEFEKMMIKYYPQESTGKHQPMKMGFFNYVQPGDTVAEIT